MLNLRSSRRGRTRWWFALATVVGLFAVSACGGTSGGSAGGGSADDTLVIAMPSAFLSLDPALGTNQRTDVSLHSSIYSSLTRIDPDLKVVGDLATSWTNPTPTTWTFELNPAAKFANGDALDADVIVQNFKRLLDPNNGISFGTDIKTLVSSVKAANATTVNFKLLAPDHDFLKRMSWVYYVDMKWAKTHNIKTEANPSGPYLVDSFDPDTGAVLSANPNYYGQQPAYKKVDMKVLATSTARLQAVQSGDADVATVFDPQDLNVLRNSSGLTVGETASFRDAFLWMNTTVAPLDKLDVRKAINYALDKQAIASVVGQKVETLSGSVLNSLYAGASTTGLDPYDYNTAKAKSLLAAAGLPDGFSIKLSYPVGSYIGGDLVVQAVADELAKVGIKVTIDALPFQTFVANNLNPKTTDGLRFVGYAPYDTSASGMLAFYRSASVTNDAKDTTFDQYYAKVMSAGTDAAYATAVQGALKEMNGYVPMAWLYSQPLNYAYSTKVAWTPRPDDWLRPFDMKPAS